MDSDDRRLSEELRAAYGRELPGESLDRRVMQRLFDEGGGESEISAAPPRSHRGIGLAAAAVAAALFIALYGTFGGGGAKGEPGTLSGTVLSAKGRPVAGAHVVGVVKTWSGGYRQRAFADKTDGKGHFEFVGLYPPEEKFGVHVTIVAPGHAIEDRYHFFAGGGTVPPVEVKLTEADPVRLIFLDTEGEPVPGVTAFPSSRKTAKGEEHLLYAMAAEPVHKTSDAEGVILADWFARGDHAELNYRLPGIEEKVYEFEVKGTKGEEYTVRPPVTLKAGGDPQKRFFLIGGEGKAPRGGFGLLLALPGGDGSAEFHPFVRNIQKNAMGPDWIVAQPIAVKWDPGQRIVWPTKTNPVSGAKFTTEEFIAAVVEEVRKQSDVDPRRIFTLSWSSSGPACYAASLTEGTPVTGSLVAMSVFKPDTLPPLDGAKGKAYYILHSKEDQTCPYWMAKKAEKALKKAGAKVTFATYEGGHGWHGDPFGYIRRGVEWLEKNARLVRSR